MGPRGAAAPHATPAESAGATERLLRPPGRVIIGPLDGAAEHGPRRHTDEADDSRSEAALRSARRAPAGPESSAYQRPGPVRGYEGPASLRTVKLLLRPGALVHAVALCFEEEVLLDEPLRHHELGSALALALAVGRRVATALAAVAAGARLARRCLASPATGSPVVPTAAPRRSAAPRRRAAPPTRTAATPRRRNSSKPHFLVYGHYDVQPPEPLELWDSPPFEPTLRGRSLFARGASDNKGQHFAHLKAVEAYLKTGTELPCDLTFVVECEEEVGGFDDEERELQAHSPLPPHEAPCAQRVTERLGSHRVLAPAAWCQGFANAPQ